MMMILTQRARTPTTDCTSLRGHCVSTSLSVIEHEGKVGDCRGGSCLPWIRLDMGSCNSTVSG